MKLIIALSSALAPLGILWGAFYLGRNLTLVDWQAVPFFITGVVLGGLTTIWSMYIIGKALE